MRQAYDYTSWSKYVLRAKIGNSCHFPDKDFILEIVDNDLPFHFYATNFLHNESPYFIVGFNGAMSHRSIDTIPPFFSFKNIAKATNLPLLSVSDSTLYLNKTLTLSWYAGNHKITNMQKNIARVIEDFAYKYNKIPILCGGSGGGFASLAISSLLDIENIVLAWNPQTDITKYYKRFVRSYIQSAYPYFKNDIFEEFIQFYKKNELLYELTEIELSNKSQVLYLQNKSDNHTEIHAMPFLKKHNFLKLEENIFYKKRYYMLLAEWGSGHVPPPPKTINFILNKIHSFGNLKNIIPDIKIELKKN